MRYVFLGMGDGNYKPAPADLTWQRRFGDCKGKTALLIALLRELGIAAEPVAVATTGGDSLSTRLPMVGAFDHVIVRAQAGGRTWWLDGTGSGSWRRDDMRTPNYSWGLPLTVRGDALVRMIAEPANQPFLETSTTIDAREGLHTDAPFTVETRMRGPVGAALHAELSQITQAQRDQGLRAYWKKEYDFVDITKVATEFDADHGVLILRMEGTARMDWGGYDYMTDGLRVGAYIDYSREPGINADAPFVMDHPVYQVTRQTILLPLVGKFTTKGADYDVTLAGTHYTRRSTIEDRIFRGEAQAKSLVPEITAREARDAEKRLQAMWRDGLEVHAEGHEPTKADIAALRKRTFSDVANLIWRGNIFLDQNDYEAAFADFDAAVKADAKSASALAHRGLANYWRNQPAPARADFEAALAIDAKQVVALRGYGALLHSLGDHEGAVDKLTASLRIDPDNTFALRHRAFSYSLLGKYTESLADAAHAIKLRPRMFEMYDLRAWIRAQQGDPEKALAEVAAMLAADPNDTNALWYASHTYARFERHAEAVEAMDRVIAKSPTAANYLKRSGVRGPDDNAGRLADIDAALKIDPGVPSGQMRRANALASAGDYRGSAAAFTAQIKASTSPSEQRYLRVLRAIVYVKLGDTASARKDLAAALSQGDGKTEVSATFYNNACWVLATAGVEAATALSACDKAVAMAPKNAAYLDSRGFVLMQLGRWQEAFAAYDESLKLRPGVASSLYGRGLARKRHCQCGDGDEDLAAALRIEPHTRRLFEKAGLTP